MIRTIAILCVAIVALDALESVVSTSAGIPYVRFMFVQIVAYVAIGFVLRRLAVPIGGTLAAVAVTAFVEATLGEWVAVAMHAAPATPLGMYVFVIPVVIIVECGLGATGWALGSVGRTARS
jgi:hypothetical protein